MGRAGKKERGRRVDRTGARASGATLRKGGERLEVARSRPGCITSSSERNRVTPDWIDKGRRRKIKGQHERDGAIIRPELNWPRAKCSRGREITILKLQRALKAAFLRDPLAIFLLATFHARFPKTCRHLAHRVIIYAVSIEHAISRNALWKSK